MGEAYISAEQPQAGQEARLPPPDVHARRAGDHQEPPPQGPSQAVGLIWRIKDRRSFGDLRRARRSRAGPITVSFGSGSPDLPPRVAYAIGRKVGDAVVRNRLRRRLREIIRELAPHLRPGTYLIGAVPEAVPLSHRELRANVIRALAALAALRSDDHALAPLPEDDL